MGTRRYVRPAGRGQSETTEKIKKVHIDFSYCLWNAKRLYEIGDDVSITTLLGPDLRKYRLPEVRRLQENIDRLYKKGGDDKMDKSYAHNIGGHVIFTDDAVI
jgi:hypothetical protein